MEKKENPIKKMGENGKQMEKKLSYLDMENQGKYTLL